MLHFFCTSYPLSFLLIAVVFHFEKKKREKSVLAMVCKTDPDSRLCHVLPPGVDADFEAWKRALWPKLKRALDGRKVKSCSGETCSKKCATCSSKGQGDGEGHHHGDKCSSEEEDEVE